MGWRRLQPRLTSISTESHKDKGMPLASLSLLDVLAHPLLAGVLGDETRFYSCFSDHVIMMC